MRPWRRRAPAGRGGPGAGAAPQAASRGRRTAVVERDDRASGTSSKSSKLVHGGLRYLQQRDFRLVYEALHERQRLRHNAPHLVHLLPFLIPVLTRDGALNRKIAPAFGGALRDQLGGAERAGVGPRLVRLAGLATVVAGVLRRDPRIAPWSIATTPSRPATAPWVSELLPEPATPGTTPTSMMVASGRIAAIPWPPVACRNATVVVSPCIAARRMLRSTKLVSAARSRAAKFCTSLTNKSALPTIRRPAPGGSRR